MAWRSSGNTNKEMVDNLKRYGVISSDVIERGFRNVDRKYFVPKGNEDSAYSDQPLKEGHVHISAPHIYGSALEALELQPNSSLSFCNIGSGTGYLSCIVAEILGSKSVNYGIEINPEVVHHCNTSINEWKKSERFKRNHPQHFAHLEIVHGNALNICTSSGESIVGFDRIYIGASVDKSNLPKITKLLSPGGILVGPVEDELVKIVRIGPISQRGKGTNAQSSDDDCIDYDPQPSSTSESNLNNEFTQQILSGVRFSSLLTLPFMETVLPSRLWSPDLQQFFPDSFQRASMELLLCSNSGYIQPLPPPKSPESRVNLAARLPRVIWLEILSYTHRKWFDSKQSETEFLQKRLIEEQANAAKAQQARADAEARCHVAERERDVYRLLARRYQSRLQLVLEQQRQILEIGAQDATSQSASLAAILPQVRNYSANLEEEAEQIGFFEEDDTSMDEDDEAEEENAMIVHEDQQQIEFLDPHNDSDDEEYDFHSLHSGNHDRHDNADRDYDDESMDDASVLSESPIQFANKPSPQIESREIRTVSMCSDDL